MTIKAKAKPDGKI